ncbi:YpbS family protein [Metabacillus fastidiosus]|uniref:YpbS family protein n=1 Tax=Metabacillus fastidiosus TaxID=1458 RepID=A0ABU6NWJ5_9BACI|nr:YpbS family protein [Metabacillus fastidiosus]MEC2075895.1 YpbS family protein [Metabacillus fastidiosus]MED4400644.1 YpbS family protein [Metabacillus fastidiosus]MED4453781.1 YpbS family protein [Metabacillus fastidiosus]MED4462815.1 YpbS family protein [Metabacillus fastidiosus]MED4532127.1 YpbS family protein [Metabacillus fastidiosus]
MSEVHKAISEHSKKQHEHIRTFARLDQQREAFIAEAVQLCRQSLPFEVDSINAVTREMNALARQGIVPARKLVSKEMVKEYVERSN